MGRISIEHLSAATTRVGAMNEVEQAQLIDVIHHDQPNLLYSVLSLRTRTTLDELGVLLQLLLVCYQAMQESGAVWPQISEAVQEYNLKRITTQMRKSDSHPERIDKTFRTHPEQVLFAYVVNEINNITLPDNDETAKRMVLVALNLVECIAKPTKPARKRKR